MIELFFVTCLLAEPARCQDRSLLFSDDVSLMACMIHGQAELAKWVSTRPHESVSEWKCRMMGADGRAI